MRRQIRRCRFRFCLTSSPFCSYILFAIVLRHLIQLELSAQKVELKLLMWSKWRRLFHSSHVEFPQVKMSASWCLVSMYRIWILQSRLNLLKQPTKATLWVLDTCLIEGLRPLIIILITAALSSKTYNIAWVPACVPLDGTWSTLVSSRLVFVVGICFRMFYRVCFRHGMKYFNNQIPKIESVNTTPT